MAESKTRRFDEVVLLEKSGVRDVRELTALLFENSVLSTEPANACAVLVLADPIVRDSRISEVWQQFMEMLQPNRRDRMALICYRASVPTLIRGSYLEEHSSIVTQILPSPQRFVYADKPRSPEAFFDILRVLMIRWIRREGPITSKDLGAATGYSYPTIADALSRLDKYVHRRKDRSVELKRLPRDPWVEFVVRSERIRIRHEFTEHSGQRRSPEMLIERLQKTGRQDVAISGIHGARHYVPNIDILGGHRLDLVIHSSSLRLDLSFMRQLDAALVPVEPGEFPQVVVHVLPQSTSYFTRTDNGLIIADELECALDLHDMHFDAQMTEFMNTILPS